MSYGRAEKEKLRAATSKHARQLFTAMRPTFADLVQDLQRSLGFYQSRNSGADVKRIVAVGSTMRLPGAEQVPQAAAGPGSGEATGLSTHQGRRGGVGGLRQGCHQPRDGVRPGAAGAGTTPGAGEPVALAYPDSKAVGLQAAVDRGGGGVSGAGGGGVAVLGYVLDRSSVYSQQAATDAQLAPILNSASTVANDWNKFPQKAQDPRQKIDNLLATLDYRGIYPMLIQDLGDALRQVNPQDPLITGGADAELPLRAARREVRIDSISTQYFPVPPAAAGCSRSRAGCGSADAAEYRGRAVPHRDVLACGSGERPAAIEVTLTGTTPQAQGLAFLEQTLLEGLRKASDRTGRPYRLRVPQEGTVATIEQVGQGGAVQGGVRDDETRPTRGGRFGGDRRAEEWEDDSPPPRRVRRAVVSADARSGSPR